MTSQDRIKRSRLVPDESVLPSASSSKRQKLSHVSPPPVPRIERSTNKGKKRAAEAEIAEENGNHNVQVDLPAATPSSMRALSKRLSTSASALSGLSEEILQKYLPEARRKALSVLSGQLPPPGFDRHGEFDGSECLGLGEQWLNLRATIKGTLQGEGNSALIVGAKGCGKSLLLQSVLRSIDEQDETPSPAYHLVQLDGAIQQTDRLSMRELARQLVKKSAIKLPKEGEKGAIDLGPDEEEEILYLDERDEALEELEGEDGHEDGVERNLMTKAVLSSLTNTTSTILTLLSTGSRNTQALPLIITLSNFDLYTSRPRQALLYVLLDAVQAGSYTPGLCIIGMTSRLDTTDLLEKRVKSRFGGRTINVWPEDNWPAAIKLAMLAGSVDKEESHNGLKFNRAWSKEVDQFCSDRKVRAMLEKRKEYSNVVSTLYASLYPIIAAISVEEPSFLESFNEYHRIDSDQSTYSVLSDLSIPEFALLIASKQLLNRDREIFNFEMCFDELKRFVSKIEMDRLGSAAATTTNWSSAPNTPDGTSRRRLDGPFSSSNSSTGMMWQGLTDRKRVMMAFRSLLQLELFQPEAALNTLSMTSSAATIATAAARAAQAVRTEYLRVKCTIFPQDIISAAKSKSRKEALGTHMIQWATSQG